MTRLLLLIAFLFTASAAQAGDLGSWAKCGDGNNISSSQPDVGPSDCIEVKYSSAEGAFTKQFRVRASQARILFESDRLVSADVNLSTVTVSICLDGWPITPSVGLTCTAIAPTGGAALTGAGGASATQLKALQVGPGVYVISVTAAGAGDEAVVQIKGEI